MNISHLLIKKYMILFNLSIFIFFFDLKYIFKLNFDPRLLIFSLIFYLASDIYADIKKKNFKLFFYLLLFCTLLILYEIILKNKFSFYFYYSVFFATFLFLICYYYIDIILKNIRFLFNFFIIFFLIFKIYLFFLPLPPSSTEPVSCGSIKNYFFYNYGADLSESFYLAMLHNLSSMDLMFQENSHFGMVAVSFLLFILYEIIYKSFKKIPNLDKFFIIIFFCICYLKISATFVLGLIFVLLGFFLFQYNYLNRKFKIVSFLLLILLVINFSTDPICKAKLIPIYHNENITAIEKKKDKFIKNKNQIISEEKKKDKFIKNKNQIISDEKVENLKKITNLQQGSLSSAVFYRALNITITSVLEKPLGWGFQNYENAFNNYGLKYETKLDFIKNYHSKDATNNFFKLFTEFGFLAFLLYLLLFICLFNNKINIQTKIFLFSFVITQSIRGAGYFNGGFIIFVFLILIANFKNSYRQY